VIACHLRRLNLERKKQKIKFGPGHPDFEDIHHDIKWMLDDLEKRRSAEFEDPWFDEEDIPPWVEQPGYDMDDEDFDDRTPLEYVQDVIDVLSQYKEEGILDKYLKTKEGKKVYASFAKELLGFIRRHEKEVKEELDDGYYN
jgi:hypothetical protein